jgi:hypothetical protein
LECAIVGNREIPKDKISKWKIKINKNKTKINTLDILIGIGPKFFKTKIYSECLSLASGSSSETILQLKEKSVNYNNHNEEIKEGDIIETSIMKEINR